MQIAWLINWVAACENLLRDNSKGIASRRSTRPANGKPCGKGRRAARRQYRSFKQVHWERGGVPAIRNIQCRKNVTSMRIWRGNRLIVSRTQPVPSRRKVARQGAGRRRRRRRSDGEGKFLGGAMPRRFSPVRGRRSLSAA